MEWLHVAPYFEPEGSLLDIYVLDTTLVEWQVVWDSIRLFEPPPKFAVDGMATEMPSRVEDVLGIRSTASPLLSLSLGGMILNCHFFGEEEIEFDLSPDTFRGQDQLDALTGFMLHLGKLTGKVVILTGESFKERPILRYMPGDDTNQVDSFHTVAR